jgi:hypothetical protein
MIDPELDGISHVNIYSQGETELGRMLSNFYHYPVMTPDGIFHSVEGYWYWLGIENCQEKETLRNLYGYNAKKIGNELRKRFNKRVDDQFEKKIITAIWNKAKHYNDLFLTDIGRLPFEHYYNFGGKVVDIKDKYLWMIKGIEKIRNYILAENI